MSADAEFQIAHLGDVGKLTINRPDKLNSLRTEMMLEMPGLLAGMVERGARAIIITGAGRAFSAGASLEKPPGPQVDIGEQLEKYNNLARAFSDLPVPLVTAVNGPAVGGGAAIALAGDIILAARSAYLMFSFAKVALVPDLGATWLAARSAGRVKALEMALLGERVSAEEALSAGLVTRVLDDEALMPTAEEIAQRLAAMPTHTLGLIRRQVRIALEASFEETLAVERDHQRLVGATADFHEGAAAFREKRSPKFVGR
jgi:2-(1,2-epoxy-1,2-dihydrophenyl)acetyl-CoA isomerase